MSSKGLIYQVRDPVGDVVNFVEEYERSYGTNHPTFHRGSYAQVNLLEKSHAQKDAHFWFFRHLRWPKESCNFFWYVNYFCEGFALTRQFLGVPSQ